MFSGCVQEPPRSTGYFLLFASVIDKDEVGRVAHGGVIPLTESPFLAKGIIAESQQVGGVPTVRHSLLDVAPPGLTNELAVLGWVPRMSGRLPLPEGQTAATITDLLEAEYNKQPDQRDWTMLQDLWQQLKDAGYPYAVTVPANQSYTMENPWYW